MDTSGENGFGLDPLFNTTFLIEIKEQLAQIAEDKYQMLFNSIDQGFFLIDVIFDENDRPIDMYYVGANNAAAKMLGSDYTGKRLRDIDSNYEEYWFEIFGKVAMTGESIRMEQYAEPDKKWYSFYIFRIGDEKSRRIGNIFLDITARKRTEEALVESEQLYRTLFKNSEDGFVLIEPIFDESGYSNNYLMVNVNQAWEMQTGLKAEDFIGKTIRESMPDVELSWPEAFANVAKSGESLHFESFNYNSNRWYDLFAFNYKEGLVGVLFRDISERKMIEETLQESEERLRALTFASAGVVYRMSADWTTMTELYGKGFLADSEEPNANWLDKYIHPDDHEFVTGVINECIQKRKTFELEHRVLQVDGCIGWTYSKAVPIQDSSGNIKEWFGMASDITERKRAEEALRKGREDKVFLLKLSDTLRRLADTVEIQGEAARLMGEHLRADRVLYTENTSDEVIIHSDYVNGIPSMVGCYPIAAWGKEFITAYKRGESYTVNDVATDPRLNDTNRSAFAAARFSSFTGVGLVKNGELVATFGVHSTKPREWTIAEVELVREVAERTWASVERAKAEEAALKAEHDRNEAFQKSIEMKDEFLSLISHEFKTPLTVINSAIQAMRLICKNELSEKSNEFLSKILQNSNRQLKLVNNLLDITRMNAGGIKIHRSNIDIIHTTRSIAESIKIYAEQKCIRLTFSSTLRVKVIGIDEEKYERILLNLLSNAIKFTSRGKSISVRIFQRIIKGKCKVCIQVKDQGIGIPQDKQQLIFDRFGQVDSSLSRQAEGTGIGLSLVKMLVEIIEGEIAFESEVGKGSTFTVLFPVTKIKEAPIEEMLQEINDNRLIQATAIEFSDIYN